MVSLVGDFVPGCEGLICRMLHTVVGKVLPSPAIVAAVEKSFAAGRNDARLLVPILQGLGKQRVLAVLPHVFALVDDDEEVRSLSLLSPIHTVSIPHCVCVCVVLVNYSKETLVVVLRLLRPPTHPPNTPGGAKHPP